LRTVRTYIEAGDSTCLCAGRAAVGALETVVAAAPETLRVTRRNAASHTDFGLADAYNGVRKVVRYVAASAAEARRNSASKPRMNLWRRLNVMRASVCRDHMEVVNVKQLIVDCVLDDVLFCDKFAKLDFPG
jgi:hypothetical protein